jgi:hypothetical protein
MNDEISAEVDAVVEAVRDTIVGLEALPSLTVPEANLLTNLRRILAEWEAEL